MMQHLSLLIEQAHNRLTVFSSICTKQSFNINIFTSENITPIVPVYTSIMLVRVLHTHIDGSSFSHTQFIKHTEHQDK